MRTRFQTWFTIFLLVLNPGLVLAEQPPNDPVPGVESGKEQKQDDQEFLPGEEGEEELTEDFPDLVGVDEQGEIMDEFALLADDSMVESASRHRQEIGMSPSAITVITREDIEASGATTVPDLLRMVPGIEIVTVSPFFLSVGGRITWGPGNCYYLLLVDGRDATLELMGQPIWEIQPLFLEDIERIEVIRGPGSSLYGANAVSGVISITTRGVAKKSSGVVHLQGGEAGALSAGARGNLQFGDFGLSVSGGAVKQGEFIDPRGVGKELWRFRSLGEYRLSENKKLLAELGLSHGAGYVATGQGRSVGQVEQRYFRIAYESEEVRALLYWQEFEFVARLAAPLYFKGIHLADFAQGDIEVHTVVGEGQWKLPTLWEPLLLLVGGGGRFSWLGSDEFLDAESYANPSDPRYHQPGISYWEWRASLFVHTEYSPVDWLTITGGVRLDYNSLTGFFPSPRLAAVFKPVEGQFLRVAVSRSFRKPNFLDSTLHPMAEFPQDSPLTGPQQEKFQEFLTRVIGNRKVGNEEMFTAEAGYLGQFLNGKLSLSWDIYYNNLMDGICIIPVLKNDPNFPEIPDLDQSSVLAGNNWPDVHIVGSELALNWEVSRPWSVLVTWTHREVFNEAVQGVTEEDYTAPKDLVTLGVQVHKSKGLVGSLYGFLRSELWAADVENPNGILEPRLTKYTNAVILVLGRLGWGWNWGRDLHLESGVKLYLPIAPFSEHPFQYNERGGGITANGRKYGGDFLDRLVLLYLQGSYL